MSSFVTGPNLWDEFQIPAISRLARSLVESHRQEAASLSADARKLIDAEKELTARDRASHEREVAHLARNACNELATEPAAHAAELAKERAAHEHEVITLRVAHNVEVTAVNQKLTRTELAIDYVTQRKMLEKDILPPRRPAGQPLRRLPFSQLRQTQRDFPHDRLAQEQDAAERLFILDGEQPSHHEASRLSGRSPALERPHDKPSDQTLPHREDRAPRRYRGASS